MNKPEIKYDMVIIEVNIADQQLSIHIATEAAVKALMSYECFCPSGGRIKTYLEDEYNVLPLQINFHVSKCYDYEEVLAYMSNSDRVKLIRLSEADQL